MLRNREKTLAPDPEPLTAPSASARRKHQPIDKQVLALLVTSILDQGMSWTEAERVYNVSHASIARYVEAERRSRRGEPVSDKPLKKRGRKVEITPEACVWLADQLERNSGVGLKALKEGLATNFDIHVETSAISKSLKLTWKIMLPIPVTWNTPAITARQVEFIPKMIDLLVNKVELLCADEQGWDLHKARKKKGHAPAGEPAIVVLQPKGDRVSLIGALSRSGMVMHHFVPSLGPKKRGVDAKDFDYFLTKLRMHPRVHGRRVALLVDNAKIHHAELLAPTIASLREHDKIEVIFLPPYSPFLNPIEYAFHVLLVKMQNKEFHGRVELQGAVEEAVTEITPVMAGGFFDKAQSYWEQAKLGVPFRGKILEPLHSGTGDAPSDESDVAPPAATAGVAGVPA